MKKMHQLMVLAGTEEYLRDREKRRLIKAAWANGYSVINADTKEQVEEELTQAGVITIEPLLIVTHGWVYTHAVDTQSVSLLAVINGDKLPTDIPSHAKTSVYTRGSTRRDRKQIAEKFCASEAKANGIALTEDQCTSIVNVTGDDLGIIAFEIYKISALMRAQNAQSTQVPNSVLSQTLKLSVYSPDVSQLVDALAHLDAPQLARIFTRYRSGDHTMLLLRSKGGPVDAVITWLRIQEQKSTDVDYLASVLGVHAWQLKNRDMPAVKRWVAKGEGRLRGLLKSFAELERAIVEGRCPNPWLACQSVFLNAVR